MSPSSARTTDPGWWEDWPWRLIQTNLRELDMQDIDAERYVESLRELHATVAMINTSGIVASYPTALPFHTRSAFLQGDALATIIEACHDGRHQGDRQDGLLEGPARTFTSSIPSGRTRRADGTIVEDGRRRARVPLRRATSRSAPRGSSRRRSPRSTSTASTSTWPASRRCDYRGDRPRYLPLRRLHRGLPGRCSAWRSPTRRDIEDRGLPPLPRLQGRTLVRSRSEGSDAMIRRLRPDLAIDRPIRRPRRVRPAGIEHGAGSTASGLAVQRLRQHEVGGELAPADRVRATPRWTSSTTPSGTSPCRRSGNVCDWLRRSRTAAASTTT